MFLKPWLSFINGKYCLEIIVQAVVDIDHIDLIKVKPTFLIKVGIFTSLNWVLLS